MLSKKVVFPISMYYVLNGNIYQAPNLYKILATRMVTMVNHLHSSFKDLCKFAEYHPTGRYRWKINPLKGEEKEAEKENETETVEIQKVYDFQSCINRAFAVDGMGKIPPKEVVNKKENMKQARLLEAKSYVQKINEERKAAMKSQASTPAGEGGKRRRGDGSGKKKKKSRRSTPAL
ncbi:MED6-domain-containing protein [Neoconidiobolus thromboides FSU 785]|nr:MED6-domain-containing protein [Neoconidiobolus thromboides FSU 785]